MNPPGELSLIRAQIDEIDDEIIPLLVRRTSLALRACQFKHSAQEVKGEERVRQVLDKVAERARDAGGFEHTIQSIYRTIIAELTGLQMAAKGLAESK
jgi:isochorismate pyruvate lyase